MSSGADPARALSGAEAVVDAAHAYAAHIQVGRGRACSGTLVSPRWLLTTRSCLAQGSTPLSAGPPPVPATASVGRASLSAPGGHSLDIVEVLPHPERNVALAKLARPLRDIEPIRVASIAPIQGELVEALGYGRTESEWLPRRLHARTFSVGNVQPMTFELMSDEPASTCKGDSGGAVIRRVGAELELVGLHQSSSRQGCYAEASTPAPILETRLDDIGPWLADATRERTVHNDLDGDGDSDVASFYDYGGAHARLWIIGETGSLAWDSGAGNWEISRSKLVSGDFDGDGKAESAIFYDYGNNRTGLWIFERTAEGGYTTRLVWDSGAGNWQWSRSKLVSGDFDGDGRSEIAALYDYGNGLTRLWLFYDLSEATIGTRLAWDSGAGQWELPRSTWWVGDIDADGTDEIGALYDHSGARTSLRVFDDPTGAVMAFRVIWDSGANNWEWGRSTPVALDVDGDGSAELGAFYRYDNALSRLFMFDDLTGSSVVPRVVWDSGTGNWDMLRTKVVHGDFDGDGRSELGAFYGYSNGQTRLWFFDGLSSGSVTTRIGWDSGTNNWDWARGTPI